MRSWMLAAAAGIAAVGWLPRLPSFSHIMALLITAVLLGLWLGRTRGKRQDSSFATIACLLSLCFLLGAFWALAHGYRTLNAWLPAPLEGIDFWLYGIIDSLPERNGRATQFELRVTGQCFELHPSDCEDGQRLLPLRRVLLNEYGDEDLKPGQRWRLRVRMNRPHGLSNPGGFDYELMLMQRGIHARGYVRPTAFNQQIGNSLTYQRLRYHLLQRLREATGSLPRRGLLHALALGERSEIAEGHWDLLTQTGTNHLVVISGLHVGFVAGVFYTLFNFLARLYWPLLLWVPAQKIGALGAIVGAALYALMAGFSLPTQRALIMVIVFMSGRLLAREFPLSLGYLTALVLVLVLAPLSAMSAGFWLSFVAVGALLLACSCRVVHQDVIDAEVKGLIHWMGRRLRRSLRWSVWGHPQWVVFIGMSVPLILWMQQLSFSSPLANIFAIPLVSLTVVPLCLFGLFMLYVYAPLGDLVLTAADRVLALLLLLLEWLVDHLSVELVEFSGLQPIVYPLAALGTLLLLLPRGWPARYLGPVLLLPLVMPQPLPSPPVGEAWISILDVGQGLSVIVRTRHHALLYDAGPGFVDGFDAGRSVVAPALRSQGIASLDRIIISHGDSDHAGGLSGVLASVTGRDLLVGSVLAQAPVGLAPRFCRRGQRWQWDRVHFEVLHPGDEIYPQRNDSSCVLRVSTAGASLLLPGDIEGAEAALLRSGQNLRSDVLVAPHHGSDSSSSPAFLAAVQPRYVVFASGYRNQFGHPEEVVQARYAAMGALMFDTAKSGALQLRLPAAQVARLDRQQQPLEPQPWRLLRRRYWSAP